MENLNDIPKFDWQGKTVLIVEDEETSFLYLRAAIRKSGVDILRAGTGLEALEMVTKMAIDLVLLDIRLPIMNGYQVVSKIKELRPNLPVIAPTAYAMYGDREYALSKGCDDYIAKPTGLVDLLHKMNQFL